MARWEFKGEVFEFDEDLSPQEATARIKEIISSREQTSAPESEPVSEQQSQRKTVSLDDLQAPDAARSGRSLFSDIGIGFGSGVSKAVQGTTELAALYADVKYNIGIQAAAKADESIPADEPFPVAYMVNRAFESAREEIGLEPEGTAGKVAEGVGQFLGPGLKGASMVTRGTRLGRLDTISRARRGKSSLSTRQKVTLHAQQAGGAAVTDFIVTTDDTEGLHDFFEIGADNSPEAKVGETAIELFAAKLANRSMLAAEAGVATVVLPPVVGAMLKGITKVGASRPVEIASDILEQKLKISTPISAAAPKSFLDRARRTTVADLVSLGTIPAARAGLEQVAKSLLKQEARILDPATAKEMGAMDNFFGKLFSNLRYRGFLDPQAANLNSLINAAVEGDVKRADRKLKKVEQKIDEFLSRPEMRQQTEITKQSLLNAFRDVLETGQRPANIPDELFNAYKEARSIIDDLSERLLNTGAVRALPETDAPGKPSKQALMQAIRENIEVGGYLRQRYAAYEDPNYSIAAGSAKERQIFTLIRESQGGDSEASVMRHIRETLDKGEQFLKVTDEQTLQTLTERQLREYIRLTLAKTPAGMNSTRLSFGADFTGRVPIRKLNTQLLNRRKVESPVLKEILGQVKNPTESYIATVSDLSTFISTDKFYSRLRQIADADMADATFRRGKYGETFLSEAEAEQLSELRRTNPTATAADLGQKTYSRYINVEERVAARKEELEEQLTQATSDGEVARIQSLINSAERDVLTDLDGQGYYIMGRMRSDGGANTDGIDKGVAESPFGAMHNIAIPKAMADSLQRTILSDQNFFSNILRNIYGGMLKLKGVTQFNKTILSPITQVRNVTSASLFAMAQGNIGNGASLGQSVDIVLRDLINKKFLTVDYRLTDEGVDYLADLQQRGVIGSSAELRELQDNLRRSADPRNEKVMDPHSLVDEKIEDFSPETSPRALVPQDIAGTLPKDTAFGGSLDKQNRRNLLWQFLGKAADTYRAGDDVWKIYNYEFESAKLREAYTKMLEAAQKRRGGMNDQQFKAVVDATTNRFKRFLGDEKAATVEEAIKNKAADNVRNLVPNYELVPQIIKDIRGLPVGNFIAFPAEIMRTGFNTLETSMKELASEDAAIREIGMRRLMGSLTTFYVAGPALREAAMTLTGITEKEMEAVNITAAPYQRNSLFVPLGRNERGNLEVMDYSHFNPYDMLIRPFEAVLNSLDESNKLTRGGVEAGVRASFEAFKELTEPFVTESIAFSALRDVLPKEMFGRAGETVTGAKVYRPIETLGKKMERSLVHMLNMMGPSNIDPFRVPVGADISEVELSRLPRSLVGGRPEFGFSETEPSTGRSYAPAGELFRLFTGLSAQEVDPERVLKFKANEFKAKRSEAATLFNDVANRDFAGEQDYVNGYLAANEARLRVFREFALQMRAFENLGVGRYEMRKILRKERIGKKELKALETGRYLPFSPSEMKLDEAKDKNHEIPLSMLNIMERELKGLSIDPDFPEEVPEAVTPDAASRGRNIRRRERPAPASRSTAPAPQPAPPATTTPPPATVNTSAASPAMGQISVEDLIQDPRTAQIARRRTMVG